MKRTKPSKKEIDDAFEIRKETILCPKCMTEIEIALFKDEKLQGYGASLKKEEEK